MDELKKSQKPMFLTLYNPPIYSSHLFIPFLPISSISFFIFSLMVMAFHSLLNFFVRILRASWLRPWMKPQSFSKHLNPCLQETLRRGSASSNIPVTSGDSSRMVFKTVLCWKEWWCCLSQLASIQQKFEQMKTRGIIAGDRTVK